MDVMQQAASIRPSNRQVMWQQQEFYGFIHFGMNTFTNREWGDGTESEAIFAPTSIDAEQWAETAVVAGMTGLILTCKHHDGFCLWPSAYSKHTVAHSPWQKDIVAAVAEACRHHNLKFGIYLSPWDRNATCYGSGKEYNDYYINQLTELLTHYGPIFEVWLDGANGEGPNGKRQQYDWERLYTTVRRLQPQAVIAVCGPDVRWVGNEAGVSRVNEWSVVPQALQDVERIADKSQQQADENFSRKVTSGDEDLGSREALKEYAGELVWYPAEVNTSIRPGWFYHPQEDDKVRSAEKLFDLYLGAVGGNATFLLNLPPTPEGRIASGDVAVLKQLGHRIRALKQTNLLAGGNVVTSSGTAGSMVLTQNLQDCWKPALDDKVPTLTVTLSSPALIDTVILRENILEGQQLERVTIWGQESQQSTWHKLATVLSVGYQRIVRFPEYHVRNIRLVIEATRATPALSFVGAVWLGE